MLVFKCPAAVMAFALASSGVALAADGAPATTPGHFRIQTPQAAELTCGRGNVLRIPAHDEGDTPSPQRFSYPPEHDPGNGIFGGRKNNAERMLEYLPPKVLAALTALSAALMHNGRLAPELRELAIVRVGYLSGSLYEANQHGSLALSLGVPRNKLENMACISPKGLSPVEGPAIGFVDELVRQAHPSDVALASVRKQLDDPEILELVMVTGQWMMAARLLETTGVPMDDVAIGDNGVPEGFQR